MTRIQAIVFIATLASAALITADVSAAPGGNGNGNGNGYGYGFGNGNGNGNGGGGGGSGGAGGAPLPALGATLFGQVILLGGLAFVWRRRQRRSAQN